jgi:hypothetical protein
MMKKLLPLALIAVACEAMAQDAQCVRERAAMVENIQAYARSDLSLLGPQGISESVLEAVRQRNAIGSSLGVLARWHTWTDRFPLAGARQYRSRS